MKLINIAFYLLVVGIFLGIKTSETSHSEDIHKDKKNPVLRCIKSCIKKCPKHIMRTGFGFECANVCMEDCVQQISKKTSDMGGLGDSMADVNKLPKNYCMNGFDMSNRSYRDKLLEFAKGPCSPIILVPGITATRLVIEIDCEVLQKEEPKTFSLCGWEACTKKSHQFWIKVPDPEYLLWVPELTSPISILSFGLQSNLCFAKLVIPKFDLTKSVADMFVQKKGMKIKIFGFSPQTKSSNFCGRNAIEKLLPMSIQTNESKNFMMLLIAIERLGYVSGLTYQALPYNFFYTYRMNEFIMSFRSNVDRLFNLTGKKIVVVGHSMGNQNILFNLKHFSPDEKEEKFQVWIVVAPPFFGSPKSQRSLIAGNSDYITLGGYFGFKFEAFKNVVSHQMSIYEICAIDPFTLYKGEPWLERIKKRIKYETSDNEISHRESGFTFLPPKTAQCHEGNKSSLSKQCLFNLYDTSEEVMIKIDKKEYKISDTGNLVEDCKMTEKSAELYQKLYFPDITKMNPEIPVILVFGNSVQTGKTFIFDENYKTDVEKGNYPKEIDIKYTWGDGTVPTWSSMLMGLKWAHEFENKDKDGGNVNAKPVILVEYCSIGFTTKQIYNHQPFDEPFKFTENGFKGINCDCNGVDNKNNLNDCPHPTMIGDSNIIKLVFEVVNSNTFSSNQQLSYIIKLDEAKFEAEINACEHIKGSIFEYIG